jgi:polyhydroxybutyrate depolymerase
MRWFIVFASSFIVGCGSSSEADPVTPFSPPGAGAMETVENGTPGGADPGATEPSTGADPGGASNEDPAAGITGGVTGTEGTGSGSTPAATPAEPVPGTPAEPPVEPPATDPAAPPVPTTLSTISTGCGNPSGVAGEFSIPLNGADAAFTVTLPQNYDASTPTPLVFGFHGRNQTHIQFRTQDAANIQTEIGGQAVVAYLKSQGGPGWNFAEEVPPNIAFFNAVYTRMLADYCVDTSRIFAVGHSSGGYFANILACRYGDVLRGIGAVAGQTQESNCVGRVAAMVVHGVRDSVVPFTGGQQSRDTYLETNGCGTVSVAGPVTPCLAYPGCTEGLPVAWCEHNEPTYQDTNHGWPSFASRAIGQFLFALGPARRSERCAATLPRSGGQVGILFRTQHERTQRPLLDAGSFRDQGDVASGAPECVHVPVVGREHVAGLSHVQDGHRPLQISEVIDGAKGPGPRRP